MTCRLLHILESPDRDPYRDPELKDLVGAMPQFYCASFTPVKPLVASQASRCMTRDEPCWNPSWIHAKGTTTG